jgi:uncharacterized phosphosugar-binding protein
MDKVRKPNISVCYTPSSEPYSITILFSIISYWCETCPHTVNEEHKSRVFENNELRKTFEFNRRIAEHYIMSTFI